VDCASTEDNDDIKDSFYKELECVSDQFQKYHIKMFLGDFNAKVGEKIFSNQQWGMRVYVK